ncbi:hypothetical protein [Chitinophaga barathri]|uniref:DUF2780 domain-containing protein n=1 Tax=Chitinophaga barathri TaxID=1647451 RepID=A0A3N4M6S4_9BACT|nr:hypothetical protein [Chitinophaga barathri]RPD38835.1 hypothetical protein EG028_22040 [Chitinophaga barathri]
MKKLLALLFIITATISLTYAQNPLDKAKSAAGGAQLQTPKLDVGSAANSILGKLTPALGLTEKQKPNVLSSVTGFLKDKSGILGMAQTDKAGYASKFAGLQGGLFGKLKTILTATQYTKFLGLKPKTNDPTNALSQLFF